LAASQTAGDSIAGGRRGGAENEPLRKLARKPEELAPADRGEVETVCFLISVDLFEKP
jgi:hypothetical protein